MQSNRAACSWLLTSSDQTNTGGPLFKLKKIFFSYFVILSSNQLQSNQRLDDLVEQTFISSEVHRCFFTKFMNWYSTVVFPTVVRMPTLEELDDNR